MQRCSLDIVHYLYFRLNVLYLSLQTRMKERGVMPTQSGRLSKASLYYREVIELDWKYTVNT
jgi:hypothetical protein